MNKRSNRFVMGFLVMFALAMLWAVVSVWWSAHEMKRASDQLNLTKDLRLILDTYYAANDTYPESLKAVSISPGIGIYEEANDLILNPGGTVLRYTRVSSNAFVVSAELRSTLLLAGASNVWSIRFGEEAVELSPGTTAPSL
jgi:hypothetical protein